jgi:hypothetical protein
MIVSFGLVLVGVEEKDAEGVIACHWDVSEHDRMGFASTEDRFWVSSVC